MLQPVVQQSLVRSNRARRHRGEPLRERRDLSIEILIREYSREQTPLQCLIGAEALPKHQAGERVELVRAIEGQRRDAAFFVERDLLVVHQINSILDSVYSRARYTVTG